MGVCSGFLSRPEVLGSGALLCDFFDLSCRLKFFCFEVEWFVAYTIL